MDSLWYWESMKEEEKWLKNKKNKKFTKQLAIKGYYDLYEDKDGKAPLV